MTKQKKISYLVKISGLFLLGLIYLILSRYLFAALPPPPHILPCYQIYDNQKGIVYEQDFSFCPGEYTLNDKAEIVNGDVKLKYNWSELTKVGESSTTGTLSVFVSGNYAYLGEGKNSSEKFRVIDVSNQSSPQEIASLDFEGEFVKEVNDLFVSGNYAYLAITQSGPGYSTYLKIIDISNPSSPTTTATYESYPSWPEWRTSARKIFVSGNYVYVTWGHGLEIIDVSDKEDPQRAYFFDSLDTNIYYSDLFVENNYLYVGFRDDGNWKGGVKIYDVSDPASPVLKGTYSWQPNFIPDHLYLEGNYLYLTENFYLRILDVSNPENPSLVQEVDLSSSFEGIVDIFINNQKLFIAGAGGVSAKLNVLDIEDPNNLILITSLTSDDLQGTQEIFVSSNSSIYLAHAEAGGTTLKIYRYGFLPGQNNQGQITTFTIDPIGAYSEIGSWDRVEINNTTSGQSIIYQILDENNQLIPDSILPGNSSGFIATSAITTIDIHNVNPSAYPKLKIKASFYTTDSFETPTINAWKIYWIKAKGTQSSNQINPGQSVNFDASDSIGDSLTYKWDFNKSDGYNWDNPDAVGVQVSHSYQTAGTYIVTLRIQQGQATAIDEKEFTITVTEGGGGGGGGGARYLNQLTLSSSSIQIDADSYSTTTLAVQLYDQYGDILITSPIVVNFSLDNQALGTLSSLTCLTDSNGRCQITFKAADQAGLVKITACAATDVCDQVEIELVKPPEPKANFILTKTVDPAGDVYPGQILTYRINYKNEGNKSAILTIQDKISLGTSYVPNSLIIDGQFESDEAQPIPFPMPLPKYGDYNETEPDTVTFFLSLVEPDQEGYVSYQVKVAEDYLEKYYYDLCQNCQCLVNPIDKPIELENNYFKIQITSPTFKILPVQPIYCPKDCSSTCYSGSSIINQAKGIFNDQIVYSNLVNNRVIPKTNLISEINLIAEPKELMADGQSKANLMACVSIENELKIQAIAQPPVILPIIPDLSGIQVYLNIIEGGGKLISGAKSYLTDKNGCIYETYQAGNKSELVKIKTEVVSRYFPIEVKKVGYLYDIEEINLLPLPPVCGNNIKERNEECDGVDLAGKTCLDFGYSAGQLKCKSNCLFDKSQCISFGGGGPGGPGGEIPGQEQPVQEQPVQEQPVQEQPPKQKEGLPISEEQLPSEEIAPSQEPTVRRIIGSISRGYQKIRTNRMIQNVNKNVTVPVITIGAAINLASSLPSVLNIPTLLQYLLDLIKIFFTQPILLLAARRKQWGTIYNSLTKYPIGLAIVRLYEVINGQKKLTQTKVTGPDGRYFFLIKPGGHYQIEVISNDYFFPTNYLKNELTDEPFSNLYFGQEFISKEGFINFDIPLDPKENKVDLPGFSKKIEIKPGLEEKEEYNLILREAKKRKTFLVIATIAPILSLVCFIISPGYYTGIIFAIQSIIWILFRNFSRTIKPKQWGKTIELETNKELSQVLVRLFAKPFNKLVAVQISDQFGRYGFLISGKGDYYLVPVKPNYIFPQEKVEISTREMPFIAKDLGMKKK